MKYILIALLFCICCGCSEDAGPIINVDDFPLPESITMRDSVWYEYASPEDSLRGIYTTFAIISHADTFPGPAKPLNIKMKPRWVIEGECHDSTTSKLILSRKDSMSRDLIISKWTDASKATRPTVFTITPIQDIIRCVLLVSDTSSQNGYRTQRCYWMYGYEVRNDWGILMIDKDGWVIDNTVYLNDKKVPLSKNLVVWLSKEVK